MNKDIFRVSWKNLFANSWSTFLSVTLVGFGVGLITILYVFQKQFQEQFDRNQAGVDLVVGSKGSPLQLILNSMFHIDAPTGNVNIKDISFLFNKKNPFIEQAISLSVGDSYRRHRIVGTNKDIFDFYGLNLSEGHLWKNELDVVIGAKLSDKEGMKIGDTFHSAHGFNMDDLKHDDGSPFRVVGVLEPSGTVMDNLILTHFSSVWKVHEGHHDHAHESHNHDHHHHHEVKSLDPKLLTSYPDKDITSVLVRFKPEKKKTIPVINMPRNINEKTPVMASAPSFELNKLLANVGAGLKAINYLGLLIGFVSALSIFVSIYNNLRARKYELAIMRVHGASPFQLFIMIIVEATYVCLIGGILGVVLAHLGIWGVSKLLQLQYSYSFNALTFYTYELYIVFGAMILGIVAALFPAWKAYKTDIISSLQG